MVFFALLLACVLIFAFVMWQVVRISRRFNKGKLPPQLEPEVIETTIPAGAACPLKIKKYPNNGITMYSFTKKDGTHVEIPEEIAKPRSYMDGLVHITNEWPTLWQKVFFPQHPDGNDRYHFPPSWVSSAECIYH